MISILKLGGVPMRREDREVTDELFIQEIMEEAMICRVGLCDGNEPYVVPVNFGITEKSIYIHSAKEGRKIEILKKNNIVCVEIETRTELVSGESPCDFSMNFISIIGKGKAYWVESEEEKKAGLDCIMKKYAKGEQFVYKEAMLNRVAVIRIDLEELTCKKRDL